MDPNCPRLMEAWATYYMTFKTTILFVSVVVAAFFLIIATKHEPRPSKSSAAAEEVSPKKSNSGGMHRMQAPEGMVPKSEFWDFLGSPVPLEAKSHLIHAVRSAELVEKQKRQFPAGSHGFTWRAPRKALLR
jgi:hypothetical protein